MNRTFLLPWATTAEHELRHRAHVERVAQASANMLASTRGSQLP